MSATDATWALQVGIKAALAASPVTALLAAGAASIFDDVPEEELFPYVTIGEIQTDADETCTELGQEHLATINVWTSRVSRAGGTVGYEGRKAARDIVAAIHTALNHATLTVTGFVCVNVLYQFSDVFREDEDTYHGVIRFRVVTEPS